MNYLLEAISNGYKFNSENRLTQVFCATFNNSSIFRKIFASFVKMKLPSNSYATTQTRYLLKNDENGILDIAIYKKNSEHPLLIIENKIEADLTFEQLKKYNKLVGINKVKKIAIVKYFFLDIDQRLNWSVYRWSEFYEHIMKKLDKLKIPPLHEFIISNFLDYLKEIGMSSILSIAKNDLSLLAEILYQMRCNNKPLCCIRKEPFKVASYYIQMLEDIVFNMHADPIIHKRLAKRLVFSPWLSGWYDDEKTEKRKNLWIGFEIQLAKPYNRIHRIGTAIHFYNNSKSNYQIIACVQDKEGDYLHQTKYPVGDLIFEKYRSQVITFWRKFLS
jgi:hypothetical protein